jgi:hypothetical protein
MPERGFVLAVLAQGVDADDELAELEELARTAGSSLSHVSSSTARSPIHARTSAKGSSS